MARKLEMDSVVDQVKQTSTPKCVGIRGIAQSFRFSCRGLSQVPTQSNRFDKGTTTILVEKTDRCS